MRLFCLLIVVFALDVCVGLAQEKSTKSAEPKTIKKSKEFYPLTLGNTWTYETVTVAEDGTKGKPKEDISKIKGVYDLPEGRFFCVEEFETAFWSRNTPKGLEDTDIEIDEETLQVKTARKPSIFYKYPVKVGDKYVIELNLGEDPFNKMEIRAIDEEVKVPAGTFKCIDYTLLNIEDNSLSVRTWFCPGVGAIKYMTYDEGKLDSISVLKSYKLLEATEKSTH